MSFITQNALGFILLFRPYVAAMGSILLIIVHNRELIQVSPLLHPKIFTHTRNGGEQIVCKQRILVQDISNDLHNRNNINATLIFTTSRVLYEASYLIFLSTRRCGTLYATLVSFETGKSARGIGDISYNEDKPNNSSGPI